MRALLTSGQTDFPMKQFKPYIYIYTSKHPIDEHGISDEVIVVSEHVFTSVLK